MLEELVARYDWPGLAERIKLKCFKNDPSLKSSLTFLRKTDWARAKVERLYTADKQRAERNRKRNKRRKERRAYAAALQAGSEPTPDSEDA